MTPNDSRQRCLPDPCGRQEIAANRRYSRAPTASLPPPARGDRLAAQRTHRRALEQAVEPAHQIGSHEVELLRPDGRCARHDEDAVALAGGLGLRRDDLADGLLPHALDGGEQGLRREALGERRDGQPGRTRLAAPHAASAGGRSSATAPGETRSRTTPPPTAPRTGPRSVVLI